MRPTEELASPRGTLSIHLAYDIIHIGITDEIKMGTLGIP
jgi:hypothetical protein